MATHSFEVRPVKTYDAVIYPSDAGRGREEGADEERLHPVYLLALILLVVGLSAGMIGCYLKADHSRVDQTPQPQTSGGGGDGGPGGDGGAGSGSGGDGGVPVTRSSCDPDLSVCREGQWEHCEDDTVVVVDCEQHCRDQLGPEALSAGCDTTADDPCLCQYGLVDGDPVPCTPGELTCADEQSVVTCSDGFVMSVQACSAYCLEHYGPNFESTGCLADENENICGCYPILDGGVPGL